MTNRKQARLLSSVSLLATILVLSPSPFISAQDENEHLMERGREHAELSTVTTYELVRSEYYWVGSPDIEIIDQEAYTMTIEDRSDDSVVLANGQIVYPKRTGQVERHGDRDYIRVEQEFDIRIARMGDRYWSESKTESGSIRRDFWSEDKHMSIQSQIRSNNSEVEIQRREGSRNVHTAFPFLPWSHAMVAARHASERIDQARTAAGGQVIFGKDEQEFRSEWIESDATVPLRATGAFLRNEHGGRDEITYSGSQIFRGIDFPTEKVQRLTDPDGYPTSMTEVRNIVIRDIGPEEFEEVFRMSGMN